MIPEMYPHEGFAATKNSEYNRFFVPSLVKFKGDSQS